MRISIQQGLRCALVVVFATVGICCWINRQQEVPGRRPSAKPASSAQPLLDSRVVPQPEESRGSLAIAPLRRAEVATLAAVRSSQFQNNGTAATYVGSDSCVQCHQDEHKSYLSTSHSRAFRIADPRQEPPDGELFDPASGRSYQIYREADQLRHRETFPIENNQRLELADHTVRYVVGSGEHARTFLVETADGFLAESPVSWFASRQSWALSPGFETNNAGFARPVYSDCLFCHTGRSEAIEGNRSRVKIHAMSIDCERCHGPGSLHLEKQNDSTVATSNIDLTIVNPGHLSRRQNEAICVQCHLDGAASADVRGRHMHDFRPGQFVEDYRIHYTLDVPSTSMKVVGHVEQLHLSDCYRGSKTLTCTTCHEAHQVPTVEDRLDFYRAKCLDCHDQQPCAMPEARRLEQSPQDDCMVCHMPSSPTDVLHVPATHHRIGMHLEEPTPPDSSQLGDLIPLGDISHLPKLEQDRCLGLGYLDLSVAERDPQLSEAYRVRARDLLEDVKNRGLMDPEVDATLAKIYHRENPPKSIQFAESVLHSGNLQTDTRTKALFALSNAYLSLRQTDLAIQPLEQLVQLRRQAGDWFLLGVCRYQAGDVEGALLAAHQAAEIRPDRPDFQALLAELYRQNGQSELAANHERRAKQLQGTPPAAP